MTHTSSQLSSEKFVQEPCFSESIKTAPEKEQANNRNSNPFLGNGIQLQTVMSELNRLSKSFVSSYHTLESQVEKLNCQLKSEAEEKQELLVEKALLSDRLQNLLTIMPAGFVVIDGQGKINDCNAMAVDILGRPLIGQLWLTVIQRAFQPQADDGHQVSLKDGRKIHIETRALDSEPGQLVVLTDLTKTRELQAELSQQQKLSSMGKMIASLAHQIRTPLSAAILYGSHLKDADIEENRKQQFSHNLMERLHFMERQITDMLNFVKGERKEKSMIKPKEIFNHIERIKSDFQCDINIEFVNCTDDDMNLYADQDALVGAVINVIENAVDACSANTNANVKVVVSVDSELKIRVVDNGIGLSKQEAKKIFEPFYTNKKKGNGLGLAIVNGIVIDHKGKIRVSSELKKGTEVEMSFPLLRENGILSINEKQEKSYEF